MQAEHELVSYFSKNYENMQQTWAAAVRQSGGLVLLLHAVGIFFHDLEDRRNAAGVECGGSGDGRQLGECDRGRRQLVRASTQAALEQRLGGRENCGIQ